MTTYILPMCYTCVHRIAGYTCTAFPEGIPDDITESRFDHRLPYPGDNGIQYEQEPGAPDYDFSHFEQPESPSIRP